MLLGRGDLIDLGVPAGAPGFSACIGKEVFVFIEQLPQPRFRDPVS